VLFYDPAERVIATLHPNHTYEKVVFDPWQQTTYDVNDTVALRNDQTGDPRTDPDIKGYVEEYFKALPVDPANPWQTWYQQRIGGAMGPNERAAAQKAVAHADTATTAHFDALGRPFLTLARNRVVCANHPLDGTEDQFASRVELDIEGNQRAVRDANKKARDTLGNEVEDKQGRIVMGYAYDMLGNRVYQLSMEAGGRWMLNDVTGKPIRSWDSRGHNFVTTYDELRRPTGQYVRGTTDDSDQRTLNRDILVDKIEYGEAQQNPEAFNLRTRIFRHSDSAGIATNAQLDSNGNPTMAYDFKGNLLHSTRQLISKYQEIPDWSQNPILDDEKFTSSTRYDALNRPTQSIVPHSSSARAKLNIIQPVFNEVNLLERVEVWLDQTTEPADILNPAVVAPSPVGISNIDYDAKGQRQIIEYKNGATTKYTYDPETFRLMQLLTKREAATFPSDCPQPPTTGWPGCQVQNLSYTYDPAGNITHIQDDAQQAIYFKNQRVEPSNYYTYDALFRLIEANGREHLGQGGATIPHSYNDALRTRLPHPNSDAIGTYVERYVYDAVGNFLEMKHVRTGAQTPSWTRSYAYAETSLIEDGNGGTLSKVSNRLSQTTLNQNGNNPVAETYQHDAHGNLLDMPQLQLMQWDYKDRLRTTQRQQINDEDKDGVEHNGDRTYYVYDAGGQRVRKVTELAGGNITEERIYLGGFETFRRYVGVISANTPMLERETLHIMDIKQRIALVETRTLDMAGSDLAPAQLIRYQFGNHLGSASLELDDQSQIISYEEYAPYGSSTYQAVRSQTETPKRYRYTGKERDEETGLSYHGARYYSCWLARWSSADPEGLTDGLNLYAYVRNNPMRYADLTGTQCDPTNACCIGPTMPSRQDDAQSSSSSNSSGGGAAITGLGLSLIPDSPPFTPATIPGAAPGTDFSAAAAQARQAYRAANVMPAGTQVQHWTKELSAAATNMDPAVMNQNLSPLQSRNALPSTTLLVDPNGAGTEYSVLGGSTYSNEHKFADRFLIPQIEDQIRAANPNATAREVAVDAGRQARWTMTGEPGPSPTPLPSAAPSSGLGTAMRAGGTVLAVGGTVFSGYAFSQDVAEGNWGSAALNGTGFVGGGLALGGTAVGSTTLVGAGTMIAAPAAVVGAGVAGWKLGQYTNENTAISDVAMAGGSAVESVSAVVLGHGAISRTLGAIGAADAAIVTAPVFVPIAVGKGIGRGAVWLWNKVF
jgi:RHS repeat-associated protein